MEPVKSIEEIAIEYGVHRPDGTLPTTPEELEELLKRQLAQDHAEHEG